MKIVLAIVLLRLLSLFPLRLLHAMAVPVGKLAWWWPWRKHAIIDTNLRRCFPDLDDHRRRQLHRKHLVEMMKLVFESGAVWYWRRERLEHHVAAVDGWAAVEHAHRAGKGVLLVGAHFGNWEILPLWVSTRLPFIALYKVPTPAEFDRYVTGSRERFGARLVASGSPAMRQMIAALRKGETIGLLADQQPKQGDGLFVDFFGTPALTMTLVNRLARRTGCAVLFASAERLPRGRGWRLRFTPAGDAIGDDDPATGMRALHDWLEGEIQRSPAQYLWTYKRFSLRPAGQPDFYPPRNRKRVSS